MKSENVKSMLEVAFPGDEIRVLDSTGSGDHFAIEIRSERFRNLPLLDQHRLVQRVFSKELASGEIHALAIKTKLP